MLGESGARRRGSMTGAEEARIARWLHLQDTATQQGPLLSPGNEFPLRTLPSLPSDSSLSDIEDDDDDDDANANAYAYNEGPRVSHRAGFATLVHPPNPTMTEEYTAARRRSTSLAGATLPTTQDLKKKKKPRRRPSDHIAEEGEDGSSEDTTRSDSDSRSDSDDLELDDMSADGLEDDEETGLTKRDRRRRRRRKRRNTLLDQRIVPDDTYTKEEKKLADQNLLKSMLVNSVLIGLWYLFSISISVYNKWMFKEAKDDGEAKNIFPFPLFTTCLHMIVQFTLASLVLFLIPSFRPRHDSLNPHAPGTRAEPVDPNKPLMTKWFYFSRLGPCGAATGMDIGLGNTSLKFISLTFFTMCKSSALGFVLIFAFLFRLEKPSWRLVFIILIMTVGVVMMVAGETAFHTLGFILVMVSACSSGFRWSLTQILLLHNPATANPFSSIFFLAPVMFVSIFILAIPVEGFSALLEGLSQLFESKGTGLGVGILLFPGVLAFLMTASEFALLKRTSVVTLSICGIFKEVVTIGTANLIFEDPLTPINLTGLVVTIGSIAAYNYMKIKKMREEARMTAHLQNQAEYAPVHTADPLERDRRGSVVVRPGQGIVRHSLQLAPGLPGASVIDSPARTSPLKRPEDHEYIGRQGVVRIAAGKWELISLAIVLTCTSRSCHSAAATGVDRQSSINRFAHLLSLVHHIATCLVRHLQRRLRSHPSDLHIDTFCRLLAAMRPLTTLLALPLALLPSLAYAADLEIQVTKAVECTRKSQKGDLLSMHYKGTLLDGTKFDSSYDRGSPLKFKIGTGQVITGWDEGLLDMCIGEGRKLIIPPEMAYGDEAKGDVIPAGSTLVFETELMGIAGVKAEPIKPVEPTVISTPTAQATPTPSLTDENVNADNEEAAPENVDRPTSTSASPGAQKETQAAKPAGSAVTQGNPMDGEDGNGECNLLGDFALLVQAALGLLAVSSLAVKRLRESPRRPMKIWFFDVSKQVFGSVLLHLANVLMSMLSSGKFDVVTTTGATPQYTVTDEQGKQPNPCSFYLLNLAIDTTIGIPILVMLLKILHAAFAHTPLANPPESIRSGNYGVPPRATWWLKQSIIYFLGLIGMKLCVLAIFALLPWIAWVGDWALRWTEGNTALQIAFVMFVFPLVMNGLQYWIIDNFIKDPAHGSGEGNEGRYGVVGEDDSDDEDDEEWLERQRRRREAGIDGDESDVDIDASQAAPLKEANPTLVPKRSSTRSQRGHEYDPAIDGVGSKTRTE
ncbi:triose phosphate translocater [Pyrenophora seminiperda CCB06]|uniref:peptidylprolyl isomerase n=1 Tax=Pyrenophora seminiperda CCB06 TaxID=1302712 RepID=A0A3M7MGT6_9PLEO|nr:triose phosphate translocater [Pyrenophora seminiperda CCB06]